MSFKDKFINIAWWWFQKANTATNYLIWNNKFWFDKAVWKRFEKLTKFSQLTSWGKIFIMFIVLFLLTSNLISWIIKLLTITTFDIWVYNSNDFNEKISTFTNEKRSQIIEKLVSNSAVFPIKELNDMTIWSATDWSNLMDKNISNYKNWNILLKSLWDNNWELILSVLDKQKQAYNTYWNWFDIFLYSDDLVQIDNNKNFNFFKDLFVWWNNSNLMKVSCLQKQNKNIRSIRTDWVCWNMWTYLALKEFMLEQEDTSIAFPLKQKDWKILYLKKYNDWTKIMTQEYNLFLNKILYWKNIVYLYWKDVWFFWWSLDNQSRWIKQAYYFSPIFNWVTNVNNFEKYKELILLPTDVDRTVLSDTKFSISTWTVNNTTWVNNSWTNVWVWTTNLDLSSQLISQWWTKEIEDWLYMTEKLLQSLIEWYITYMTDIIFSKSNVIWVNWDQCLLKNSFWSYLIYKWNQCETLTKMKTKLTSWTYKINTIVNWWDNLNVSSIEKMQIDIPMFWLWLDKMWFRIMWFAPIDGWYEIVLRNYAFTPKDSYNENKTWDILASNILWWSLMFLVFLSYLLFYNTFFVLWTMQLALSYNKYLEELWVIPKG